MISFKTSLERVSKRTRGSDQNNTFFNYLNAFRYYLWSNFLCFFGEIQIFPRTPLFLMIGKFNHKIKAKQIREMLKIVKPGDILIRRYDSFISGKMIPGYYTHVALYCGKINNQDDRIIHALGEGVVEDDFIDFCNTDEVTIIRTDKSKLQILNVITKALLRKGSPYDYDFNFSNDIRFSCTELLWDCFDRDLFVKFYRNKLLPDAFLNAGKIVYSSNK